MTPSPCFAATLLLLLSPGADVRSQTTEATAAEDSVIATVNGEPVYFEDLERVLGQLHRGAGATDRRSPDLDRLVFRVVNDTLLAQEARILGMQNDDPVPASLEARREQLAVDRLEQEEIWSRSEPTEEEVRDAFEEQYRTVTLRMVTVRERDDAEALKDQIEEGADIGELAREHSIDPYKARGGRVEDLARVDMPRELADEAFSLDPGELAGPLPTRIGWSVFRVESFAEPEPERMEELRRTLVNMVRSRKADALRTELAGRLRERHPVSVDAGVLEAISLERRSDMRLIPKVEDPDAVVARVGDRSITAGELGRALRLRWTGVQNEEAALAARPLVLDRMIDEELLKVEALARGYGDTPEARRVLHSYETQLLVPRFLREVVGADVEVTLDEMKAYYNEHTDRFRKPPRLRLGQITVTSEEEAEQVARLLREGADLAWLARQHSVDEFKDAGGDRGWVTPSPTTGSPLERALLDAAAGDIVGPEAQGDRFVVLRVGAREPSEVYPFDEVSGNVRQAVREQKEQQSIHEVIQMLRSRSEIEIHDEVLARMRISGSVTEEAGHGGNPMQPPGAHE
jgi:peptidyl-prolyl cis-trans isomerase C